LWCSFKLWWNFCPDLSSSKFHSKGERSIATTGIGDEILRRTWHSLFLAQPQQL
jgi:hypothetical protein